jgi:hypothetical protein
MLDFWEIIVYTNKCCDMIAVKREVAAQAKALAGVPWSECQEPAVCKTGMNLTTSHCTIKAHHRMGTNV